MTEKTILAFFRSPEDASEAKTKLSSLQITDMSLDQFSRFPGNGVDTPMNPITGNFSSLASLTQGADISSRSAGILVSADDSASGMSDGGDGGPTGYNYLLTVVLEDASFHQAVRVIEECGGKI